MLKRSYALALLIMSSSAPALAQTEPAAAVPLANSTPPTSVTGSTSNSGANPFKRSTLSTLPPPPPVTGGGQVSGTPGETSGTSPPPLYSSSEVPVAPSRGRRVGKIGDEIIYRKEGIYSFEAETLPGGLMPAPMLPGMGTVIAPVVATVVATPGTVVQGSAGPQPLPQPVPVDPNANGRVNVDPSGPKPVVPQ